jgi:hypothetical protein
MRYADFVEVMSPSRTNRYLYACGGNTRKAMTLYRKNMLLTQELFTVVGCFEISLRNAIDALVGKTKGQDWLRDSSLPNGIFDSPKCRLTRENILDSMRKLPVYNHNKLVAELGFGFWRFMFAQNQFNATGRVLLQIFPGKPRSSAQLQLNHTYFFNRLAELNQLRNRMAHHEPICFLPGQSLVDTTYARQHYSLLIQIFNWMEINPNSLLFGLDHIEELCLEIDKL